VILVQWNSASNSEQLNRPTVINDDAHRESRRPGSQPADFEQLTAARNTCSVRGDTDACSLFIRQVRNTVLVIAQCVADRAVFSGGEKFEVNWPQRRRRRNCWLADSC
jgi:hypothetical protein